jgi:hypothetical protein
MTEKDIVRLAEEAELWLHTDRKYEAVEKFANLVAAEEREACAQIAFNANTYLEAAAAIRARGQDEKTL